MTPFMNPSKQIKTTRKEAESFNRYMETLGYVTHRVGSEFTTDIHFTKDGKTTIDHAVTIIKGHGSYIMVRVSVQEGSSSGPAYVAM